MTRSAVTSSRNMSSRMLPCRMNSPVVPPSMSISNWLRSSSSAFATRSRSTRSKSMPSLVPKGRTIKARMGFRRLGDRAARSACERAFHRGRFITRHVAAFDGDEHIAVLTMKSGRACHEQLTSGTQMNPFFATGKRPLQLELIDRPRKAVAIAAADALDRMRRRSVVAIGILPERIRRPCRGRYPDRRRSVSAIPERTVGKHALVFRADGLAQQPASINDRPSAQLALDHFDEAARLIERHVRSVGARFPIERDDVVFFRFGVLDEVTDLVAHRYAGGIVISTP